MKDIQMAMTLYSRFFNKYNNISNFAFNYWLDVDEQGLPVDPWTSPEISKETYDVMKLADESVNRAQRKRIPDGFDVWGDPIPKGYPVDRPLVLSHLDKEYWQKRFNDLQPKAPPVMNTPKMLPGASTKTSFPTGKALAIGAGIAGLGGLGYLAWQRKKELDRQKAQKRR